VTRAREGTLRRVAVARVARCVRAGGVVAYPTEGVYALGCDAGDGAAVARVLALKARDAGRGFIVIAATMRQLEPCLDLAALPRALCARLEASWPGPVTWVVPARAHTPRWLTGGRATLAVRVTAHPLARALCEAAGCALVSTSANRAGRPPARTALAVRRIFGARIDALLAGACGPLRGPTEIRDLLTGRILRPSSGLESAPDSCGPSAGDPGSRA
jgi:L-threonylcarbamoyladenylate synthase